MLRFIEVRELHPRALPYRFSVYLSAMHNYATEGWGYAPMMNCTEYRFTTLAKALDKAIEAHKLAGYPIVRTHGRLCPTIADMGHRPVAVSEAQRRTGIDSGFAAHYDDGIGV
jgi:hypothetical protein